MNMGSVEPPQHKGHLQQFRCDRRDVLKFDDLEHLGVFRKPEDIVVTIEYLNLLFLVKKASGGYRLVTDFAIIRRYSKPQLSLLSNMDSTL